MQANTLVTLWHSGMLLILLLMGVLGPTVASKNYLDNFKISHDGSGFKCSRTGIANDNVQFRWKLNGEDILVDEGSAPGSIELSPDSVAKLECFATSDGGTSYAFYSSSSHDNSNGVEPEASLLLDTQARSFECSVTNLDGISFSWIRNGQALEQDDGLYQIQPVTSNVQRLLFNQDFLGLSGIYGCLIKKDDAAVWYEEKSLDIPYYPKIQSGSNTNDNEAVKEGSSLKLTCSARSTPDSNFYLSWTFNGDLLTCEESGDCAITETGSDLKTSTLTLTSLRVANAGHYKCIAMTDRGSGSSGYQLQIESETPPIIHEVAVIGGYRVPDKVPVEFLVTKGTDVVLDCDYDGGARMQWTLPDLSESSENPLAKSSVQAETDQGRYTCSVMNKIGQAVQSHVDIVVVQPSRIQELPTGSNQIQAPLESTLELVCRAVIDARLLEQTPTYTWLKDDQIMDNVGNVNQLTIDRVEGNHKYTCLVKTVLDNLRTDWTVSVKQSPIIAPTFPTKMALIQGQSVIVPCLASGIPHPEIEWVQEEPEVDVFDNREVVALNDVNAYDVKGLNVTISSGGLFKCIAINEHGRTELGLFVTMVKPTSMPDDFLNGTTLWYNAGDSLTLNCSINVDTELAKSFEITKSWTKDGKILDEPGDYLTIPYLVDREHSGAYSCIVKTPVDTLITSRTVKVITKPPRLSTASPKSYSVAVNTNVRLNCSIESGIPEPTIQWKFKDSIIDDNSASNVLVLDNVTEDDEGEYTCLAVNEYGSDLILVNLNVIPPPIIDEGPQDLVMKTLGTVRFPCQVLADPRIANVSLSWSFNDIHLLDQDGQDQLILDKVTKNNEGSYTCHVKTPFGDANQTARLTVLGEPPSFIATEKNVRSLEGGKAVLSCQANGLPMPEVNWLKDGLSLNMDMEGSRFSKTLLGDLTIEKVEADDQGSYDCVASNLYGQIKTTVEVEVIKKSIHKDDISLAREVVKNVHDNVTLHCGISFDPRLSKETEVEWFKMDQNGTPRQIVFESTEEGKHSKHLNQSLTITELSVEDRGKYLCSVQTPFEKMNFTIELFVHGEPPKILSNFKQVTLYEGQELVIPCLVKGVPLPDLQWFFNEHPLEKTKVHDIVTDSFELVESRVRIQKVSKAHEGVYQCEAGNTYGSGVAKFAKVNVVRKTRVQIAEEEVRVHAGEKLKIPCNVDIDSLNMITNITWTVDGMAFIKDKGQDFGFDGSILLYNVQKKHEGSYRCTVTTKFDSATASVPVKVVVNAPVIISYSEDQVIFNGNNLDLLCTANGIPEPSIMWYFNKTETKTKGTELRINNAILSDSGEYVCDAKNQYGHTRKAINVKVIQTANLKPEYLVEPGHELVLPCVHGVEAAMLANLLWRFDDKVIKDAPEAEIRPRNGSLQISNMTEAKSGVYSCTASLPNRRRQIVQTVVRLKPDIILSQGIEVAASEGEDVFIECILVPGIEAKRLWQYNGDFFDYGPRRSKKNQGGLLMINRVRPEDAGNYSCIAINNSNGKEDVIVYEVRVRPASSTGGGHGQGGPDGVDPEGCRDLRRLERPVGISGLYRVDNITASVKWRLPEDVNKTCYSHVAIVYWTNASEGHFWEEEVDLDEAEVELTGLDPGLAYYVQVNLVAPFNILVYGSTKKFVLDDLTAEPEDESGLDSFLRSTGLSTSALITIVVLAIFLIIVITVLVLAIRRRRGRDRFAKRSVIKNNSMTTMCCGNLDCYNGGGGGGRGGLGIGKSNRRFHQKTNFNGFDTGMYDAAIINTAETTTSRNLQPPYKRSSLYDKVQPTSNGNNKNGGGRGDFMSNLTPQWPEPEPEEPLLHDHDRGRVGGHLLEVVGGQEYEPFLRSSHTTFDPSPHHRRRNSKESIGSSWSSLFNVPESTTGTISLRPNSVAVSNLSSSGSAADYGGRMASIGARYRKSNNNPEQQQQQLQDFQQQQQHLQRQIEEHPPYALDS